MRNFFWHSTRKSDYGDFYCGIEFDFYGTEADYKHLVHHYNHLAEMYRLDLMLSHKWESDGKDIESYVRAHFRKSPKSDLVPPNWLKVVFEKDVKILQRTFQLGLVQFFDQPSELSQ